MDSVVEVYRAALLAIASGTPRPQAVALNALFGSLRHRPVTGNGGVDPKWGTQLELDE